MKIEKITENKIKIFLNIEDLKGEDVKDMFTNIIGNASSGIVKIINSDFKEQKCGMNHGVFWFKENKLTIITDF